LLQDETHFSRWSCTAPVTINPQPCCPLRRLFPAFSVPSAVPVAGSPGVQAKPKAMTWLYVLGCIAAWGAAAVLMKVTATHVGPFTSVVGNMIGSVIVATTILSRAQLSLTWAFAAAVTVGMLFP